MACVTSMVMGFYMFCLGSTVLASTPHPPAVTTSITIPQGTNDTQTRCKPELDEVEIGDQCLCRHGKHRQVSDKPCVGPDQEIRLLFCLVRFGETLENSLPLVFNDVLLIRRSNIFKNYSQLFEQEMGNVLSKSPWATDYVDTEVAMFGNPKVDATYSCSGILTVFRIYFKEGRVPSDPIDLHLTLQGLMRSDRNASLNGTRLWIDWIYTVCQDGNPCPKDSECTPTLDGRNATCRCQSGFEDMDPAHPGYNCTTSRQAESTGATCLDMPFCERQNATCKDGECICRDGWIKRSGNPYARDCGYDGAFCLPESEVDLCCLHADKCVSGSTCKSYHIGNRWSYNCTCLIGGVVVSPGTACPSRIEGFCAYCNNHGTCTTRDKTTLSCICETWYAGDYCQIDIREILFIVLSSILLCSAFGCCIYSCVICCLGMCENCCAYQRRNPSPTVVYHVGWTGDHPTRELECKGEEEGPGTMPKVQEMNGTQQSQQEGLYETVISPMEPRAKEKPAHLPDTDEGKSSKALVPYRPPSRPNAKKRDPLRRAFSEVPSSQPILYHHPNLSQHPNPLPYPAALPRPLGPPMQPLPPLVVVAPGMPALHPTAPMMTPTMDPIYGLEPFGPFPHPAMGLGFERPPYVTVPAVYPVGFP